MADSDAPARPKKSRQRSRAATATCRTCRKCRTKKVKCDGARPSCALCSASKQPCVYLEDARKTGRLSRVEIEALQNELAAYRQLRSQQGEISPFTAPALIAESKTPVVSFGNQDESWPPPGVLPQPSPAPSLRTPPYSAYEESPENREAKNDETQIAWAMEEDGSIQVHGATSHLRQPGAPGNSQHRNSIPQSHQDNHQAVKDQLFANAALQRQREASLFLGLHRLPTSSIDLDGLQTDLAVHLLDLHWNRQHFAYLLTYRPAIIDSLINNGPYVNKLLLNAIYYSSCLYSDRTILRLNPDDPESMGEEFYLRFKQLLPDEIDRPSLPTVAALLICGTTLVSNGKQSAGWMLCGLAYRAIIDLGCHLNISAEQGGTITASKLSAIEIEMRTRIYWGAFLTDKFQSLYLGRPSSLRPDESRVSKVLLDHFEELENWSPYVDPIATPSSTRLAGFQGPRAIHAITTFQSMIPLGEIASSIVSNFYAIDSIRIPADQLSQTKNEIQESLDSWLTNLPLHLRFDPKVDPTPPPNQITPHATYHTLIILLERPFLANGHLSFVSAANPASQSTGEKKCAHAAIQIWHLVDAFKRAFTLRRAPYFLSYAAFSAIVVILHQNDTNNPEYVECIIFFWYALLDLQKGCTSGLRKPLKILQSLMHRLGRKIPSWDPKERRPNILEEHSTHLLIGNICNKDDGDYSGATVSETTTAFAEGHVPGLESLLDQFVDMNGWDDQNWMDTMMNDQGLMDDSLFGLFTPGQSVTQGVAQL